MAASSGATIPAPARRMDGDISRAAASQFTELDLETEQGPTQSGRVREGPVMAKQKEKQEVQHVPSADAESAVEQTSSLHGETAIADLIGAGSAGPPVLRSQAAMFLSEDSIACNVVGDAGPASEFLFDSIRHVLEQTAKEDTEAIASCIRQGECQLIFSTEFPPHVSSPLYDSVYESIWQLSSGDLNDAVLLAQQHGIWTFEYNQKFALTFVSCNSPQIMMERLVAKFERVQDVRERIDAERAEWLHNQAEPLLDVMDEQLLDSSLPEGFRSQIVEMREQIIVDAYFAGIIETSDVAEALGVDESRVRQFAREGRLGLSLSRHYVFSQEQLNRFAEKDRPHGVRTKKP